MAWHQLEFVKPAQNGQRHLHLEICGVLPEAYSWPCLQIMKKQEPPLATLMSYKVCFCMKVYKLVEGLLPPLKLVLKIGKCCGICDTLFSQHTSCHKYESTTNENPIYEYKSVALET